MTKKRKVHVEELRELGFSEDLIQEAVEREKAGLLDDDPPPLMLWWKIKFWTFIAVVLLTTILTIVAICKVGISFP